MNLSASWKRTVKQTGLLLLGIIGWLFFVGLVKEILIGIGVRNPDGALVAAFGITIVIIFPFLLAKLCE